MKCIHHDDMDGRAAARVIANFEENYDPEDYFETDYATELPLDEISKNEKLYIVDYSFSIEKKEKLDKILKITDDVIWIDHHKSSIELINKYPEYKKIKGIIKEGISGAALAYMYLYKKSFNEIPIYLRYVSDYDCWKYKYGDDSRSFKCFIDSVDYTVFSDIWGMLGSGELPIERALEEGNIIYRYIIEHNNELRERLSYEGVVDGHKALIVNAEGNSWVFGDMIKEYEICVLWTYNGEYYNYSLYSDQESESPLDVSEIARKHGGGGHHCASGVQSKDKIW